MSHLKFIQEAMTATRAVPAKVIKKRFSDEAISKLLKIKWWDWPWEKIQANIKYIQSGDINKVAGLFKNIPCKINLTFS